MHPATGCYVDAVFSMPSRTAFTGKYHTCLNTRPVQIIRDSSTASGHCLTGWQQRREHMPSTLVSVPLDRLRQQGAGEWTPFSVLQRAKDAKPRDSTHRGSPACRRPPISRASCYRTNRFQDVYQPSRSAKRTARCSMPSKPVFAIPTACMKVPEFTEVLPSVWCGVFPALNMSSRKLS
jgi:hypothetical protein